jgi:hypothetical protein
MVPSRRRKALERAQGALQLCLAEMSARLNARLLAQEQAEKLSAMGITAMWIPRASICLSIHLWIKTEPFISTHEGRGQG